jgi:hypothetical protein
MSSYRNERRKYVPLVGDEVVLAGRFEGKFLVEEVDADEKTAVLRHMRTNALVKGAMWTTMYPLKHLTKINEVITAIEDGQP